MSKEQEIADWAESEQGRTELRHSELSEIDAKKLQAWQLRKLKYTANQVATALGVHRTTINRWFDEVEEIMPEIPEVVLVKDAMRCYLSEAVRVYGKALRSKDLRLAKDAAKDLLITHDVLRDKKVTEDDNLDSRADRELIDEAQRIIATAAGRAQAKIDNSTAKEA